MLGIVKTVSALNEPPEVLGKMIGGALVGTILGVFLAYGFVGPMAARLKQIYEEDAQFYIIIRAVIVAHLQGHAPQVSIEMGRSNVPSASQPSFTELEERGPGRNPARGRVRLEGRFSATANSA